MKKKSNKDETSEFRKKMLERVERHKRWELILKILLVAIIIVIGVMIIIV